MALADHLTGLKRARQTFIRIVSPRFRGMKTPAVSYKLSKPGFADYWTTNESEARRMVHKEGYTVVPALPMK